LQLGGGSPDQQRAIYQPFNLVVLALASLAMIVSGQMSARIVPVALLCLPVTLAAAWIGARLYVGLSPETFKRIVLCLLLASGCILLAETVWRA
ncbi:MAG TPA: sulfite exporter TauE/SafE family protein, partial [Hyphomicrobiaceae bacterium]|nr:sulfite exporter TauE/SafE family protein [Hyphomicrobiaceae bacterium]